jgi:hypothetical protein
LTTPYSFGIILKSTRRYQKVLWNGSRRHTPCAFKPPPTAPWLPCTLSVLFLKIQD